MYKRGLEVLLAGTWKNSHILSCCYAFCSSYRLVPSFNNYFEGVIILMNSDGFLMNSVCESSIGKRLTCKFDCNIQHLGRIILPLFTYSIYKLILGF